MFESKLFWSKGRTDRVERSGNNKTEKNKKKRSKKKWKQFREKKKEVQILAYAHAPKYNFAHFSMESSKLREIQDRSTKNSV